MEVVRHVRKFELSKESLHAQECRKYLLSTITSRLLLPCHETQKRFIASSFARDVQLMLRPTGGHHVRIPRTAVSLPNRG